MVPVNLARRGADLTVRRAHYLAIPHRITQFHAGGALLWVGLWPRLRPMVCSVVLTGLNPVW